MRDKIDILKQKMEEHKVILVSVTGGIIFGSVVTGLILQELPTKTFHEFRVPQTVAEIQQMLEEARAIELSCPHMNVVVIPSDHPFA